jgi:hypothetical protein
MKIKLLTGTYILLLAVIVFCADQLNYQYLFAFIRAIPGGDKLGHFILMGLFAFLVNICLSCRTIRIAGRQVLVGSIIVITVITIEELSQSLIPYRSFDLFDLMADYLGGVAFGQAARLYNRKGRLRPYAKGPA